MKRLYTLAVVMVLTASAFAQSAPTGPVPTIGKSSRAAIHVAGMEKNAMWSRIDTNGKMTDIRLRHPVIGVQAGIGKHGFSGQVYAGYQFRWFTVAARFGMTQIKIEGAKMPSYNIGLLANIDIMSIANPKSRFLFSTGVGLLYNHVSFTRDFIIGDESEYTIYHRYEGNAFGPLVNAEAGFLITNEIAIMAQFDWTWFSVHVSPGGSVKYNTPKVSLGIEWKIGRVYKRKK